MFTGGSAGVAGLKIQNSVPFFLRYGLVLYKKLKNRKSSEGDVFLWHLRLSFIYEKTIETQILSGSEGFGTGDSEDGCVQGREILMSNQGFYHDGLLRLDNQGEALEEGIVPDPFGFVREHVGANPRSAGHVGLSYG